MQLEQGAEVRAACNERRTEQRAEREGADYAGSTGQGIESRAAEQVKEEDWIGWFKSLVLSCGLWIALGLV